MSKSKRIVDCHSGEVYVFRKYRTKFYGGGIARGSSKYMDLTIELHDVVVPVSTQELPSIKYEAEGMNIVYIPIEDMGIPEFSKKFWYMLYQDCLKFSTVLVRCFGGHGRTGMVLAIFAGLAGYSLPCVFVRECYCKNAIETYRQAEYVKEIVGCKGKCRKCIKIDAKRTLLRSSLSEEEIEEVIWYGGNERVSGR